MKKKVKNQVEVKVEVYTHLINDHNELSATICLLSDKNNVIARGISLCSKADQFSRKEGRKYALRYALRAFKGRFCEFRRDEAKELLDKISVFKDSVFPLKKGEVNPVLTIFEAELIRNSRLMSSIY